MPWLSCHCLLQGTGLMFLVCQCKDLCSIFLHDVEREFKEQILFWLMSSAFCGFYGKSEQTWMFPLSSRSPIKLVYFEGKKHLPMKPWWLSRHKQLPASEVLQSSCPGAMWLRAFLWMEVVFLKCWSSNAQSDMQALPRKCGSAEGGCMLWSWVCDRELWCNTVA